jgi:predicted transcriptional regulator
MTEDDTQPMTIRLPRPVHEQLRRLAFDTRKSMNDIAVTAITQALKENQNAHVPGH